MSLSMPLPVAVLLGVVALLVAITAVTAGRTPRPRRLSERWSVDVLRHVPGWSVLTTPDGADVDRVVVAPGAVLAVVLREHNTHADRLAALAGAEHVRRALRAGRERAAHPVVAVLAVTGRDAAPAGGHDVANGVQVVDGIRPERWLHCFAGAELAADEQLAIVSAIAPGTGVTRTNRLVWRPARGAA
jgi:hypothetical protein